MMPYRTLIAATILAVVPGLAEAQSTRYFARMKLSGASSSASSQSGSASPYDGVWGTYETGRYCHSQGGYNEVMAACYTKQGIDYGIEHCDPATRPLTQPPCA